MPSCSAARHSSVTSPTGSAAARSNSRRVSAENDSTLPHEALLDAAGQRRLSGQPESARERDRRPAARQLEQRERVAAGFTEDPILHQCIDGPGIVVSSRRRASSAGSPSITSSGRPFEPLRVARLAHPKYQSNPFGQETTRHEREHPYRHPVKPLRVVDDAHKRPLLGGVGKQAQDSQTDRGNDPAGHRR